VGGNLQFRNLTQLSHNGVDLSSLEASGGLIINNTAFETLPSLPVHLSTNSISLINNPALLNTAGLESLQSITGDIAIDNNPLLSAINFAPGIAFSGAFTLTNNAALAACATNTVCQLLALASSSEITDNAAGRQTLAEAETACSLLGTVESSLSGFSAYQSGPSAITLLTDCDIGPVTLTLCDLQGRALLQKSLTLPFGKTALTLPVHHGSIYLLHIAGKEGQTARKLPLF
jgi:hypothetical protein